jgi:mycofactocin precursor
MSDNTVALSQQTEDGTTGDVVADEPIVDELLVEEVSIDGMCGVY